jgi:hypothetical protein
VAYPLRFWLLCSIPPILRDERVGPFFLLSCSLRGGCPRCRFCTWVLGLAEAVANGGGAAVEGEPAEGVRVIELPVAEAGGAPLTRKDEFGCRTLAVFESAGVDFSFHLLGFLAILFFA